MLRHLLACSCGFKDDSSARYEQPRASEAHREVAAQRRAHGAKPAGNPHVGLHDVPFLGVAPCEQDAASVCIGQAIERQRQHVATDTVLQLQAPTPALPNSPTPNGPADSRSSSHSSSSSSSSSSSRLRDGLIEQSPYWLTAVSLDGRCCFQSPRSAQYFGDLKAQAVAGGKEARAGLAMDVLHRLFALEGEIVLEEMLSAVLGGEDASGRQNVQRNWCKVIRVPPCCHTEARQEAAPQAQGRAASTSDRNTNSRQSQFRETQQARQRPSADAGSSMAEVTGDAVLPSPRLAQAGPSMSTSLSVLRDEDMSSTAAASAVSVGIRYADGRVKSLLNLTRKSIDTRGPASPFARTLGTSPQLEDFEPGLGTSSAQTLPPPLLSDGGSSFRSKPERSETLPRFPSAMGSPAALDSQLLVGCSKRLLTIVSAAVLDSSSNAARGSFEERRLSFAQDLEPARPSTRTTARGRSTASGTSLDAASALTSPLPSRPLFSTVPESAPVAPADGVLQDLLFGGPSTSGPDEEGQPELQPACWHEVYITCTRTPSERDVLLIYQTDVTMRTQLEATMAQLTELQLNTLCQIFPRHVIEFLSSGGNMALPSNLGHLARSHADVSVLFMDICGFTSMSEQVAPDAVMTFLNSLFSAFDDLCEAHRCHKVETAGDCYIVSSGLLSVDAEGFAQVAQDHDPAESTANLFAFAKDMLAASREVLMPHDGSPVQVRIGIHTGPCVSGVVGSKLPKFAAFGDTMNTASRMESTCTPGRIQISAATHSFLLASGCSHPQEWEATGGIAVKGKGMMETYLWREPIVIFSMGRDLGMQRRHMQAAGSLTLQDNLALMAGGSEGRREQQLLLPPVVPANGVLVHNGLFVGTGGAGEGGTAPGTASSSPRVAAVLLQGRHLLRSSSAATGSRTQRPHGVQGNASAPVSAFHARNQLLFQLARGSAEAGQTSHSSRSLGAQGTGSAVNSGPSLLDTAGSVGWRPPASGSVFQHVQSVVGLDNSKAEL